MPQEKRMKKTIRNLQDAQQAIDEFNSFHDGFIQKLCILSHDRFEARGVQSQTGDFDLEITFAHYNYRDGETPPDQLVKAIFNRVKGIEIAFSGLSYEWSVNHVEFREGQRTIETNDLEPCLAFALWQPMLTAKREWELKEVMRFTFTKAEFMEL